MGQSVRERSAREEESLRAINAGLEEARVLVVEDDDAMRAFLEESLREEGYIVRTASNTLSAIVSLLGERADVLVIDWKMPDLDGFALLSAVKRCFSEVPVIFVTAFARPDIERRALDLGAFSFLPKPFRLSVLVANIQRALQARPAPGGDGGDPRFPAEEWRGRPPSAPAKRGRGKGLRPAGATRRPRRPPDYEGPVDPGDRAASE
jgi:DNA-binding response OmpR family regulator